MADSIPAGSKCMHEGWPGPNSVGPSVSYLLVRSMFMRSERATVRFIKAVKDGKGWRRALEEDYGRSVDELISDLRDLCARGAMDLPPQPQPLDCSSSSLRLGPRLFARYNTATSSPHAALEEGAG